MTMAGPRLSRVGLVVVGVVVGVVLLLPGSASAWVLNQAQLDTGYCGQNLQMGSDPTVSNTATPSFLLWGDGQAGSYAIFIDGVSIGTFTTDMYANVCIRTTVPLANGAHTLTGNELAPRAGLTVTPFSFSVDTVAPSPPSALALNWSSDTGVAGDSITNLRSFSVTGSSVTGQGTTSIRVVRGGSLQIGGATPNASTGSWLAACNVPADGTYVLQAFALDEAANQSALSAPISVTVDTVPPSSALSSPAAGVTVSGMTAVAATASDNLGVWKVVFQVDGVTKATDTSSPYTYSWDTTGVADGSHTVTEVATDLAGNTSTASATVTVSNSGAATVPGAPTLNSAAAGNNSVALSWSAPGSNGGAAVSNYKVYRGTSAGGESLLTTLGNVTSWTDGTAANGTTYYYKVSAVNSVGEGAKSNEMSASPTAPLTVPGAPALNTAAAGNASVALSWSAPASNGGAAVSNYKVYRGTSAGGESLLTTLGNVTSWTDGTAANGSTYYYKVSAVNSVGEGSSSNEMSASPTAPLTAPSAPTLNTAAAGNASAALAWSAPTSNGGAAVTNYKVYRGTSAGGESLLTTLGNVTSWTDGTAANGTTYYYKVSAVNSVGEGSKSNEMSASPAQTATVPGVPTLTTAKPGNNSVALAWSAPGSNGGAAVTNYEVYRGTSAGGETLLTMLGNVTSWTDSSAVNGTTYYYRITAVNSVGQSSTSNEMSATPAKKGGGGHH
jgi:fibronectin type 3 domain-containing protein